MSFDLGLDDPKICLELSQAVRSVRTSRLHRILMLEIGYPVDGMVHQTIEYLCIHGVPIARYDTLDPERVIGDTTPGHLSYLYETGTVVDQYAISSREEFDQDDPMIDFVQIEFQKRTINTRRKTSSDAKMPRLYLVEKPTLAIATNLPARSGLVN